MDGFLIIYIIAGIMLISTLVALRYTEKRGVK